MKQVFIADNPAQAHLIAGMLDERGIEAVVQGEMLTGARFEIGADASTLPTVCVRDEDFERARAVILEQVPPKSPELSELEEKPPQSAGLLWFKRGLLVVVVAICVGYAIALLATPGAFAIAVLFLIFLTLAWPRRRK